MGEWKYRSRHYAKEGDSDSNTSDLYCRGTYFKSSSGHRLTWFEFFLSVVSPWSLQANVWTLKQAVTPSFQILSHSLIMSLGAIWFELLKTSWNKPQTTIQSFVTWAPSNHWTGDRVNPRADLEAVEKRKKLYRIRNKTPVPQLFSK